VQEYYPDAEEEFNTRSPHNIVITTFGRMGAVGTSVWLAFLACCFLATWRVLRHSTDPVAHSLWVSPWVLLAAASLGVVLEGPMGAVVFWSLLGLASAVSRSEPELAPATVGPATSLPQPS